MASPPRKKARGGRHKNELGIASFRAQRGEELLKCMQLRQSESQSHGAAVLETFEQNELTRLRRWADKIIPMLFQLGGGNPRMTVGLLMKVLSHSVVTRLLENFGMTADVRSRGDNVLDLATASSISKSVSRVVTSLKISSKGGTYPAKDYLIMQILSLACAPDDETPISRVSEATGLSHNMLTKGKARREFISAWDILTRNMGRNTRKDKRELEWLRELWHEEPYSYQDSFNTRLCRKWLAPNKYELHHRHIQLGPLHELYGEFCCSPEYATYLRDNPNKPISFSLFCQSKCFCVKSSEFAECVCTYCNEMNMYLSSVHKIR